MSFIKKQVTTQKYDKAYFGHLFKSPDYSKKVKFSSFGHIYRELASLSPLFPTDRVVDFGCGNGDLSFCLYQKYQPTVLGIDYSSDAIEIAQLNLKKFSRQVKKPRISFLNVNNHQLPQLKNINCIYFCDVLEHMYDEEIEIVIGYLKHWNKEHLRILVHTDNDIYLRFIRPTLDLLSVLLRITTFTEIKLRNAWEAERHVNLTNPARFRRGMARYGFREVKVQYSKANMEKIARQLAGLAKLPFLSHIIFFCLSLFQSLSPSFYGIYEYHAQ